MADIGNKITPHLIGLLPFGHISKANQHCAPLHRTNPCNIAQGDFIGGVLGSIVGQIPGGAIAAILQAFFYRACDTGLAQDGGKMATHYLISQQLMPKPIGSDEPLSLVHQDARQRHGFQETCDHLLFHSPLSTVIQLS